MEGTPADLTAYKDDTAGYQLRDHSYYGNGCPGSNTSTTPCSTRIVETDSGDPQKNGTYYHFQAATAGSGGVTEIENTNTPDTFCPLGWQLPYSGTGGDYDDRSKSWKYLFTQYGIGNDRPGALKTVSYPLSNIWAGYFQWYSGSLQYQSNASYYWSTLVASNTTAYATATWFSVAQPGYLSGKGYGFVIRCN